jgi:anti-sigma factor RsiW
MMCPQFEERIAQYVGGDLPAGEAVAVEQHLRQCSDCAELARALEDDREWLASRPLEAVDIDFLAMRQAIRRETVRPRFPWKWAAIAAAILMAVGLATMPRKAPDRFLPNRDREGADIPNVSGLDRSLAVAARKAPVVVRKTKQVVAPRLRVAEAEGDPSIEIRIATRDPNVTIILLHESKGVTQ